MTAALTRASVDYANTKAEHYADPGLLPDGKKRYALDSADECRAAWSYVHQAKNAAQYTPKQLREVEDNIRAAGKDFGIEFAYEHAADQQQMGRSDSRDWGYDVLRSYALEDIEIERGGDGRTVTAYAAMFGQPYEVNDKYGHYMEEIERSAFNRTIANGNALRSAVCLYNHGYTASGSPDALLSVPLGTPVDIRAEAKGLLTVTRYNGTAMADATLESIRNGDIRSQSFRGRTYRSTPERVPKVRAGQGLPTIVRNELGLSDYGPTPFAVNTADMGFAVRSMALLEAELDHLDPDERAELIRRYEPTPLGDPGNNATPDEDPGAEDSPMALLSALTQADIARDIRVWQIMRGKR